MAKHYDVPALGVGLNSDAKVPGIQAAYESMQTGLAAALSGAEHLSACWLPRDKAARDGLRRKALSQIVAAEA